MLLCEETLAEIATAFTEKTRIPRPEWVPIKSYGTYDRAVMLLVIMPALFEALEPHAAVCNGFDIKNAFHLWDTRYDT